jgi:hypothetical protein
MNTLACMIALLHDHSCHSDFVPSLSSFLALPNSESEMQHWLSVLFSSVANISSVSKKTQANISVRPDLTMIKKHHKFSKWNQFRQDSFLHDISPAIWVSSNTGSRVVPNPHSLGYNTLNHAARIFSLLLIATC